MTDPNGPNGLVGQIIADRYRIDKKLGGGGMGEVYLAEHVRIQRKCAVKVLRAALSDDNDSLQRFEREAKNASLISHPNVAQVYDFGEHGNLLYLVMEFIEGQSMQEVIEKDGVMHPDMVADVIMQSASALEAAHAQHVLHRDVKPDNIMLAKNTDGTYMVKLVDFGIARAMQSNDKRVTQTGMVVGTPEFMSPEQIAGEALDGRSDLYSLALVAFQALTGDGAFPDTGSMESLILRLTSRPRTLIEVRQSVSWPPKLQTVFDKALAPQREARHETVVEFAADLSGAIVQMSPSETQAFYRRALEARAVNPVALTPSATPAKPSKEKVRGKTAAAKEEKAAPPTDTYRPMGMPGRPSNVSYDGPTVRKTSPWRLVLLVAAVFVGIAYWDDNGVVATKFDGWGVPAVTSAFNKIREFGKKEQLRQSGLLVDSTPPAPVAPVKARITPRRVAPADTTRKPDTTSTVATPVTPPKADSASGTVPPPPAR
ncbi:MAG: protein kinase [Phycisphaerae bacterium]|nr:protein kinase [Gemmatimonadaceae bacterium]